MGVFSTLRDVFLALTFAAAVLFTGPALAQPALFTSAAGADISPQQQAAISRLRAQPTSSSVQIVRVDPKALLGNAVMLALPGLGVERADRRKTEARSASDYTWTGDIPNGGGRALLVVRNGEITGQIESPTYRYSIVSLGGGVHALIRVDQSRFPPDHPPGGARGGALQPVAPAPSPTSPASVLPQGQIDKTIAQKRATMKNGLVVGDSAVQDPIVVDILVAWTVEARTAYGGNMAAFAQLAVDAANAAYTGSNANVSLRLAGTREVTYSETGRTFDDMLNAVTAGTDPLMAPVHTQRASVGADLVSLLINNTAYCGLAWLNSVATTAFSAVYWNCAVSNHSFAHEIGHNFGARHDPYVDPTNTPYAYAHGYITPSNAWRTIMAYVNGCGSCPRLGYFSNPSVLYQGLPMGTTATHDNARVHRERVATVAAFGSAAPPTPPANDNFANAIALPTTLSGSTTGQNTAATKQTGEPSHAGNAGGASVWWTLTPSVSGSFTIDTFGSGFDTILAVYTGSAVNALTLIAQNDDSGAGTQSSVTFQATAGVTYRIAVDGYNSGSGASQGNITLNWLGTPSVLPRKDRDFNADAKADILWRDTSSGNVVVSLMNGASIASSTFAANLPVTWSVVGLGDFNADSKTDILWRNTAGNVVVSLMNGAAITSSTFVATLPLSWTVVGVGDFNGDGKADILWRDTSNGNLVVSLMNGASITSSTFVATLPLTWSVAGVGDFNADGKADILWRDSNNGNVVVSLMNGATITSSTFVATLPLSWSIAALGDFNGDARSDILWRDTSNGNVVVSLMNGSAISSSTFVANLPLTWAIQGFNVN